MQSFFEKNIGLSENQISAIRNGKPVAKTLPSRNPSEVFLFGAVYILAAPERYLQFARDLDRLRKLPNYMALEGFSNPPQLSDLNGFSLESGDIRALRSCRPGNCLIQMPASSIEQLQQSIDWSSPDVDMQVNQYFQKTALERLLGYQREGNQWLGVYNDKLDPTEVPKQFAYMLTYDKVLPEFLPDFYHYLLAYPNAKPKDVEDTFYWAKVKFGLKPTLRVVHVAITRGNTAGEPAFVIAEKQLYSSHYFETALDLTFCVPGTDGNPKRPGFYLIKAMGSEQAGLTGPKGSIIRKAAVDRSVSSLRDALTTIKDTLESGEIAKEKVN